MIYITIAFVALFLFCLYMAVRHERRSYKGWRKR